MNFRPLPYQGSALPLSYGSRTDWEIQNPWRPEIQDQPPPGKPRAGHERHELKPKLVKDGETIVWRFTFAFARRRGAHRAPQHRTCRKRNVRARKNVIVIGIKRQGCALSTELRIDHGGPDFCDDERTQFGGSTPGKTKMAKRTQPGDSTRRKRNHFAPTGNPPFQRCPRKRRVVIV